MNGVSIEWVQHLGDFWGNAVGKACLSNALWFADVLGESCPFVCILCNSESESLCYPFCHLQCVAQTSLQEQRSCCSNITFNKQWEGRFFKKQICQKSDRIHDSKIVEGIHHNRQISWTRVRNTLCMLIILLRAQKDNLSCAGCPRSAHSEPCTLTKEAAVATRLVEQQGECGRCP